MHIIACTQILMSDDPITSGQMLQSEGCLAIKALASLALETLNMSLQHSITGAISGSDGPDDSKEEVALTNRM